MERCERHDLPLGSCADCTPRPAVPAPDPAAYGPWFVAAYDGTCAGCGYGFCADDTIRSDGQGGWLARCCGHRDEIPAATWSIL